MLRKCLPVHSAQKVSPVKKKGVFAKLGGGHAVMGILLFFRTLFLVLGSSWNGKIVFIFKNSRKTGLILIQKWKIRANWNKNDCFLLFCLLYMRVKHVRIIFEKNKRTNLLLLDMLILLWKCKKRHILNTILTSICTCIFEILQGILDY